MFEQLFSPVTFGTMTVKNRIFMAPMSMGIEEADGTMSERMIAYWEARAKGGVGCIILDVLSADPKTPYLGNTNTIRDEKSLATYQKFTAKMHEYGTKVIPQLSNPGPESVSAFYGVAPKAPSNYVNDLSQNTKEISIAEIQQAVKEYGEMAARIQRAGFDGIELHAAHAYMMIGAFLSPLRNRRLDEYGGNLLQRARFLFEVLASIRENVGPDFPIILRVSGDERLAGGNTVDDFITLLPELEKRGVTGLEISSGAQYELPNKIIGCLGEKDGFNQDIAGKIKAATTLPVLVVGRIRTPQMAESILAQGKADAVVVGRQLLSDPAWAQKVQNNQLAEIVPCTACGFGCIGGHQAIGEQTCVINPLVGKELEKIMTPAAKIKNIAVVGGGMAGMAAAITCARRGHHVTLYEKSAQLGGQLNLACLPPHKQTLAEWGVYYQHQLDILPVTVQLNTTASAELLDSEKFDSVIVATGATPNHFPLPGIDDDHVFESWDIIANKQTILKGNVVIIGGGEVGLETAELLYQNVRGELAISVLEMAPEAGQGMIAHNKKPMMARLNNYGLNIFTKTKVVSLALPKITAEQNGQPITFSDVDYVVLAMGSKAETQLYEELKATTPDIHLIGDAKQPRQLLNAVREGVFLGMDL